MEHLRKLADGQGEEIALLHGENRELRAENERLHDDNLRLSECWATEQETHAQTHAENKQLRAAARRVMKAYAGNDTSEQMKALGALSDALVRYME
jgi:hypothetical protein